MEFKDIPAELIILTCGIAAPPDAVGLQGVDRQFPLEMFKPVSEARMVKFEHQKFWEYLGLGCTVEMIREMRKDANMRAKLRAKLTGKRRNDEDDDDDFVEASRMESDEDDDEGRAAIGRSQPKVSAEPAAPSADSSNDLTTLTKSQRKRLKKKQKLQRNSEILNRLKNG